MNICRDCEFYRGSKFGQYCRHPELLGPVDPVHGGRDSASPRESRKGGLCGPEGRLFSQREPEGGGAWKGLVVLVCIAAAIALFAWGISQ